MKVKILNDGTIYMLQDEQGRFWMGPRLLIWEAPAESGASVPCWMTTSRESAEAQAALLECGSRDPHHAFIDNLNKAIEWRRTNTNDPHGIDNAVIAALHEVRKAMVDALNSL